MTVNEKGQLKNKGGRRNMEKKTGRSRKAVQPLKPKKLVYWAVAIPAFLALLLFAIVFLKNIDEPEHNSKTVHLKTDFKKFDFLVRMIDSQGDGIQW